MPELTTGGLRLHWEEHIPMHETGHPVVLVHGLGSSGEDWLLQTPVLGIQRRLLAPDLPGHGRGQGFRHWPRTEDFAAAVSAMLREALSGRMENVAEWVAADLFPKPDQAGLCEEAAVRLARNRRSDYLPAMAAAAFFNVWPRLGSVNCPTLIVTGGSIAYSDRAAERDRWGNPRCADGHRT